jgi:hypothetical protein
MVTERCEFYPALPGITHTAVEGERGVRDRVHAVILAYEASVVSPQRPAHRRFFPR